MEVCIMKTHLFLHLMLMSLVIGIVYFLFESCVFATENAMFPMEYLNISQGANDGYSHAGRVAIDICGRDTGQDAFYAPFTGTIKKTYDSDNIIWLESNEPVQFANGTVDYMTIMCMHDNDISDLWVGKVIQQGEHFLTEGTAGHADGNHIHLECGRGKFMGSGWYQNSYGKWCINNGVMPYDALFLSSSTKVINGYGYNWRYANDTPPSSAKISIDKESVKCGETFKITCTSDTSSQYYMAIFDADSGEKIIAENVPNGVFQNSFQKAGKYNAYMTAYNSEGSVNSNWITFYVFGDPPSKATLSVNKTEMTTNDTVTLKTYTNAYYVRIYTSIFRDDNLSYSGEIPYDFNYKPTSDGIYTAHITAYTHEGGVDSNWVTFYVGKYSISYNGNGGSGVPSTQTKIYGKNLIISNNIPNRDGYTFKNWNTKPSGTGESYYSGDVYNSNSNATLYAQWEQNPTVATTSTIAIRNGNRINIQTSINNLNQKAVCITALYDKNGVLLKNNINDVDSSTGSVNVVYNNDSTAAYVKVFLWNSIEGMKPLTNGEKIDL